MSGRQSVKALGGAKPQKAARVAYDLVTSLCASPSSVVRGALIGNTTRQLSTSVCMTIDLLPKQKNAA
jgi:hypothetical protein